jgi:hypothetical protein
MNTVKTLSGLLDAIRQLQFDGHEGELLFRGETNDSWNLVPKAGRSEFKVEDWWASFNRWREKARALKKLPTNEWRQLAIAQHHGFATPLLDWSSNPLIAAYFAVGARTGDERDGVLYCFRPAFRWNPTERKGGLQDLKMILRLGKTRMPFPALSIEPFSERLRVQSAVFTVHADDSACMKSAGWPCVHEMNDEPHRTENLSVFRVPWARKASIRRELEMLDITHSKLFPDLDGISEEVNQSLRCAAELRLTSQCSGRRPRRR